MPNFTQKSVALLERNQKRDKNFNPNYQSREASVPKKMTQEETEVLKSGIRSFALKNTVLSDESLTQLVSISDTLRTSHKQHVLFHGENIHKAQQILKDHKKGAFGFWLAFTYGNRQTCYNFLNYFLLYQALPINIRPKLEKMPLKNAYLLGSVDLPKEKKQSIISSYKGEDFRSWRQNIVKSKPQATPKDESKHHLKIALNALKKINKTKPLTKKSKAVVDEILELLSRFF